jgi:hypothetical protein
LAQFADLALERRDALALVRGRASSQTLVAFGLADLEHF